MLLRELVRINEAGLIADAVNFDMIADEKKNLLLCQGFVFNYDRNQPKSSSIGVLDALRRSYHSPNEPNVHLLVQDYGKGKSHFGLVIANFFKQSYESPEVQGILNQLKIATSNDSGKAIFEGLKSYKQRTKKHLVISLSGEQGDIKKLFLRALRQTLEAEGIKNSIAQHLCAQPIEYLEKLDADQLAVAEKYLEDNDDFDGDVKSLIQLLKDDDYQVIDIVVKISRELIGHPLDFETDLNIEAILQELINNYCSGENRCFEGILILLDELNAYLQTWANNSAAAGGMALQNITNICENYKGKIALISFTQIRPSNASAIPRRSQDIKSYQKLTSRLELNPSTYEPISSLELVLSNLITPQNESLWKEFIQRWNATILAESRDAYEKRISIYKKRNWGLEKFYNYLALKCFPLHPVTAYLLCNLDFTQGRTAIQFIKEDVKNFIENKSIEIEGKLNYVYPVKLVDAFEDNFSNYSKYKDYQKAYDSVIASASSDEITILKGIFLFYASGNKLIKLDRESHEDILEILTGLSPLKIKKALDKLSQTRRVIYQRNNTYDFYSGVSIVDLEEQINNEVERERSSGRQYSVKEVLDRCRSSLSTYLNSKTICATDFVSEKQLLKDDWQFERQIYTIYEIQNIINSNKITQNIKEKGLLGYVIAETEGELQNFRNEIDNLLKTSPIRYQIAIAISRQGTTEIANDLHFLEKLRQNRQREKKAPEQAPEQAHLQLVEQYKQKIEERLKQVFKSCTYHCSVLEKIPLSERTKPERIISELLKELYPFVPPVNKIDKMALTSRSGPGIISFAAKRILANDLTPQILPSQKYKNVLDPIFVERWGLLKKTSKKYSLKVPTHEKVRQAWDEISKITDLEGKQQRSIELSEIWQKLSAPPYGYNEFTFTVLLAAWLAYHSSEVSLKGGFGIPQKKSETVNVENKSIKEWATTNILDNPKKFINDWILSRSQPKLIRRRPSSCPEIPSSVNYDEARKYVQEIEDFIRSDNPDPLKVRELQKKLKQLNNGIEKIDDWFKPVEKTEKLPASVEINNLPTLYSSLLKARQLLPTNGLVLPTQQQKERFEEAFKTVPNKIKAVVYGYQKRAKSLKASEEYGEYKVKVENAIKQLEKTEDLPNHLITTLESSLEEAKASVEASQEQKKIDRCLSQIQNLSRRLGSNATQNDYIQIVSDIEKLVESVPEVKSQQTYQQIIKKIEQQQNTLNSSLEQWQKQYVEINSSARATQLKEQIIRQQNRFTESDSQEQVKTLLTNLESKITELRSQEEILEKQEAAQKWLDRLANKEQEFKTLDNDRAKLKTANDILDWIKIEKNTHFDILNQEQQQLIEQFEKQCQEIINRDQESQIIAIFQKLTDEQKINLHNKLSQYLPN